MTEGATLAEDPILTEEATGEAPENGFCDIFTDGACSGNPGPGGWGAILRYRGVEKELKGFEPVTTNNRMELLAAIVALETLKRPLQVRLHTDIGCAAIPAIPKTNAPTPWRGRPSPKDARRACGRADQAPARPGPVGFRPLPFPTYLNRKRSSFFWVSLSTVHRASRVGRRSVRPARMARP